MKTVRELFSELDEWKAYQANSTMISIAKVNHISRVKMERTKLRCSVLTV